MQNEHPRLRDLPAAAVLFLALLTSVERLVAAGWADGLEAAAFLAAIGAALGMALGRSRFRGGMATLLALGYSLFFVPWLIGARLYTAVAWDERLLSLGGRLADAFLLMVGRRPVEDPILFIAFACAACWTLSLSSGYALTRRAGYLAAILPGGVSLFLVQLFDPAPQRIGFLAFYLFLCLVLFGRLNYLRRRDFWQAQHVKLSSESATDLNGVILFAAAALIFLAWAAPSPEKPIEAADRWWTRLAEAWQPALDSLGNAVAGLDGRGVGVSYDFYGDTLELGRSAATGDTVIFSVLPPATKEVSRYYWRVRVYDTYEQEAWSISLPNIQEFSPQQARLPLPVTGLGMEAEYTFTSAQPLIAMLFTPPNTFWVSRPGRLTFARASAASLDPLLFAASPAIRAGETYQAHSFDFDPTEKELRAAGREYPDWVVKRYLRLPEDLPPRLVELAQSLAEGKDTPYDQAKAITGYLRGQISYTLTVPRTPFGRDALEWFLFDHKQGFCNYYATAEVMLLRAAGIPARLAVGFAQGEQGAAEPAVWTVRQKDAHAWPEAYFPGLGWVQFEPTVSQPPLTRPSGEEAEGGAFLPQPPRAEAPEEELPAGADAAPPEAGSGPARSWLFIWGRAALAGLAAASALFLLVAAWKRYSPRLHLSPLPIALKGAMERFALTPPRWLERWARRAALTPLERAFGAVYQSLRRLGAPASPSQTPAEAAAALSARLPSAAPAIQILLREVERSLYSQKDGHLHPARRAAAAIRAEARRAALRRLLARARK
jgi:transglutaminase-like putative cysteine protease